MQGLVGEGSIKGFPTYSSQGIIWRYKPYYGDADILHKDSFACAISDEGGRCRTEREELAYAVWGLGFKGFRFRV